MTGTVRTITKLALLGVAALVACEAKKSSNPLSPTVAGPIAGVAIEAPVPVSPVNGAEVVNTEPLRLVFNNASTNGQRALYYEVELASDANFGSKLFATTRIPPGDGGRTSVVVDGTLAVEHTYYWRVKALDGANESSFSSTARFDLVVPVVIEAPTPASPVGGQTTSTNSPTFVVNNGRISGRTGDVFYRFLIARDAGFSNLAAEKETLRSGGSQTTTSATLPDDTLFYWRVVASNGTIHQTSRTESFRTPAAPRVPVPTPAPGPACQNGRLVNPKEYFFQLIGRTEGSPAGDWYSVLQRSGLPAGPTRGVKVPADAPFYGLTQQINSSGQLRGRIFLPTEIPDEHGYYIHHVDVLSDANATYWVWRPLGGPPYVPRACR